jgi:hypothetical protein
VADLARILSEEIVVLVMAAFDGRRTAGQTKQGHGIRPLWGTVDGVVASLLAVPVECAHPPDHRPLLHTRKVGVRLGVSRDLETPLFPLPMVPIHVDGFRPATSWITEVFDQVGMREKLVLLEPEQTTSPMIEHGVGKS